MMTRKDDIRANKIEYANFRDASINNKFAEQIAVDLRSNTSITRIDFYAAAFAPKSFEILCDALISRKIKLVDLNLDYSNIDRTDVVTIKSLMVNDVLERINLYWLEDFDEDEDLKNSLCAYAAEKKVVVSFAINPFEPPQPTDKQIIDFYRRDEKENCESPEVPESPQSDERKDYRKP